MKVVVAFVERRCFGIAFPSFRRGMPGFSVVETIGFVPRTVREAHNDINGFSCEALDAAGSEIHLAPQG